MQNGAMVYRDADFDAPVIGQLKQGDKVIISKEIFGAFHKIRIRKGTWGYISDVEVRPLRKGKSSRKKKKRKKRQRKKRAKPQQVRDELKSLGKEEGKNYEDPTQEENKEDYYPEYEDEDPAEEKLNEEALNQEPEGPTTIRPFWATRYVGGTFGTLNFKEETFGQKISESLTMFGVKFTGPDLLVKGQFIMDINVQLSLNAPQYYQRLTGNGASGMLILADFLALTPLDTGENRLVYFGLGPMVAISKFSIVAGSQPIELTELRLGAAFNLGIGLRFKKWAVKAEARYNWEAETYFGYFASVQYEF